ncbi:hypothetical protein CSV75_01705 [Sporosarcina sp. P18a]|uniref:hypothetical protein n=1 Tax=Sporosarcina sp. P18a TaxID=2048259 RepID=UPI000C166FF9|nr:hypothetical protein [Sporosarcina sp. P18a]PIC80532.1 hypothetical protein CSV75_01705 [Sporosarcina sp. P18a]
MNNGMDDFFKQQAKFQRLMSQVSNPVTNQIANQMSALSKINQNALGILNKNVIDSSMFDPMLKMINDQATVASQIKSFSNWQTNISRLIDSQTLNLNNLIPDSLFDSLADLTSNIDSTIYQSGNSDILSEVSVPSQTYNTVSKNNITWESFITIMLMIIQLMMQFQDGITEQERHEERMNVEQMRHEEIMVEERKQTELQERSIHIQEQILIENQTKTNVNQISEEQYQVINEKLDLLLKESLDSVTENPTDQDTNITD